MLMNGEIVIYESESELYSAYIKHGIYNYPIKCKSCNGNVSISEHGFKCNCREFNTMFRIGIKVI